MGSQRVGHNWVTELNCLLLWLISHAYPSLHPGPDQVLSLTPLTHLCSSQLEWSLSLVRTMRSCSVKELAWTWHYLNVARATITGALGNVWSSDCVLREPQHVLWPRLDSHSAPLAPALLSLGQWCHCWEWGEHTLEMAQARIQSSGLLLQYLRTQPNLLYCWPLSIAEIPAHTWLWLSPLYLCPYLPTRWYGSAHFERRHNSFLLQIQLSHQSQRSHTEQIMIVIVVQLCLTLCDPMDYCPLLFMEFSGQEYWR